MNRSLLLATFTKVGQVRKIVKIISENLEVNKIFVLADRNKNDVRILTYNTSLDENEIFTEIVKNTISLHRKKESNTLYTLNALNEIVKSLNDGKLDANFKIDWQQFKNTLLITQKDEQTEQHQFKKIYTKFLTSIDLHKQYVKGTVKDSSLHKKISKLEENVQDSQEQNN